MARSAAEEIAIYLRTLSPSLGTIKVDELPASPYTLGCVNNTGGSAPDKGFGTAGVRFEHPTVQVLFRGEQGESEAPRLKAMQAHDALAAIQAEALSGTFYHEATPMQPPFRIAKDANNCVVWGFNVYIEKEPSV
jgi:hypothetical protein